MLTHVLGIGYRSRTQSVIFIFSPCIYFLQNTVNYITSVSYSKLSANTTPMVSVYLSVSTIKQISGHAGWWRRHWDAGGTCAALHAYHHRYLETPFAPLQFIRIGATTETATTTVNVLLPKTLFSMIIAAHSYIGRISVFLVLCNLQRSSRFRLCRPLLDQY